MSEEHTDTMENSEWVVVGTFPHGMDLVFLEALLEEEGIRFVKQDEMTVQVVPLLSQAIGGVRVLVHPVDRERTLAIFRESGIDIEDEPIGSPLLEAFETHTKGIPLIGRLSLGWRFLVLISAVLVPLSVALHAHFAPSSEDLLTEGTWCVTWMEIDGQPVSPRTVGQLMIIFEGCPEIMSFARHGALTLPGLNTPHVQAEWILESDDRLRIMHADTIASWYDGLYAFRVNEHDFVLRSEHVRIEGKRQRFDFGF